MSERTILIADQDIIDSMLSIARPFVEKIFGMDFDACLLTDDSMLSDFFPAGIGDDPSHAEMTMEMLVKKWDQTMIDKIHDEFGVTLSKTTLRLIAIFPMIEARAKQTCH